MGLVIRWEREKLDNGEREREREGMRKREGRERKEREKMRKEREIAGLKQFESIKKIFFLSHSATVPSYIWDGTVAICQQKFGLFPFGFLVAGIFWACMPNVSYIWHMQGRLGCSYELN